MRRIPGLLAAAAAAAVACSDSFQPTTETVSGIYSVQTFTTDSAGGPTKDWVAAGATLDMVLNPGGIVAGQLIMPGVPNDTSSLFVLLDGTWSLTGETVHFTQGADTFVRRHGLDRERESPVE